jgi:hypothetical protein
MKIHPDMPDDGPAQRWAMHSKTRRSWTVRSLVLGCAAALLLAVYGRVGDREDGPARDAPSSLPLGRYPALGGSDVDCRDLGYAV